MVDLSKYFCDDKLRHAVVGNVVVYFDIDHLNGEFSRSLAPMLAKALK
ncbi:SGNH hydrolase domain-containing protein [Lentzea sp. HUAS TT2]